MNKDKLWSTVLSELEIELSPPNFATWMSPNEMMDLKQVNKDRYLATIGCPSIFHKNQISERYIGQIQSVLEKQLKKKCEIKLEVSKQKITNKEKDEEGLFSVNKDKIENEVYQEACQKIGLNPNFTFKNFAVSSSNEVAHAAAKTASEKPGQVYHLVFLYGGVGVGKTHLMQAAGHRILKKNPDSAVIYCTGEEFTNEIIEAIRNKTTPQFRFKYRKARILLLDDVQFIGGKEKVQEEFFHTFNAINKEGGQVILTSDRLPSEIDGLEDRLKSRFEGGLTVDIQEPEFELRTAILLIKAQQKNMNLKMEVAQVIAANVESVRKMEGVLLRLSSEMIGRKEELNKEMAMALLGKINGEGRSGPQLSPAKIMNTLAGYYQLKKIDLTGDRRLKSIALPRQVLMYLLRKELQLSYQEIGKILGDRDHTTIMHGEGKISRLLGESEKLRLDLTEIRKELYKKSGQLMNKGG